MRKLKGKIKAVVNMNIAIVIVAIILVSAIGVYIYSDDSTPYWETESEFGMWQDELYVEFADGTTESLKLIQEESGGEKTLAVKYLLREITYMGIKISAVISGTGYTGAELKFTGFGVRREIRSGAGVIKKTYDAKRSDGTLKKQIGSTGSILTTGFNFDSEINNQPSKYPNGPYIVTFKPIGTVQYRGYPDGGNYKSASLPPGRIAPILVMHTPTGTILVSLRSEGT